MNKMKFLFLFLFLCAFTLLQPFGFDIYYHLFYLQTPELDFYYNKPNFLFGIPVNRYLLLSDVIYFSPFPVLITISLLTAFSWIVVVSKLFSKDRLGEKVAIVVSFYFLLFWTPVTISVGLILSSFILFKKYKYVSFALAFFSILFHPISMVLFFLLVLVVSVNNGLMSVVKYFCGALFLCCIVLYVSNISSEKKSAKYSSLNATEYLPFDNIKEFLGYSKIDDMYHFIGGNDQELMPQIEDASSSKILQEQELRSPIRANSFLEVFQRLKVKATIVFVFSIVLFLLILGDFFDNFLSRRFLRFSNALIVFPVFLLLLILQKGFQNGSSFVSLFELNNIKDSDLFVDGSILISLASLGYNVPNRTMLIDGYSDCFIVNRKFVDQKFYDFEGNVACLKEYKPHHNYRQQCLINNPYQNYIEYSSFQAFYFNRITAFIPDYNSLACTANVILLHSVR